VSDTQKSTRPQTLSTRESRVSVHGLYKFSSRSAEIAIDQNRNANAFAGLHLSVLKRARLTPRQNEVIASAQWTRRNRNLSGQMASPMAAPRSVRVQSTTASIPKTVRIQSAALSSPWPHPRSRAVHVRDRGRQRISASSPSPRTIRVKSALAPGSPPAPRESPFDCVARCAS
jgi:hypothetical protein